MFRRKNVPFPALFLLAVAVLVPAAEAVAEEGPTWSYFYRALDNGGRDKTILEAARVHTKAGTFFRVACLRRFKPPSFAVTVKDVRPRGTPLAIRLTKNGGVSVLNIGPMPGVLDSKQKFIEPGQLKAFLAADKVEIGTYNRLGWELVSGPQMIDSIQQLKCLKYLKPKET